MIRRVDQGHGKESQTGDDLLQQAGEKAIQAKGALAGFRHDDFIASQDVGRISLEQMLTEEAHQHLCPRNDRVEPALDGTVTATGAGPA